VGGEGRVKFAWIRTCKSWTAGLPGSAQMQAKKKEWKFHVECTSGLGRQHVSVPLVLLELHCKKGFVILTFVFLTRIATVDMHGFMG